MRLLEVGKYYKYVLDSSTYHYVYIVSKFKEDDVIKYVIKLTHTNNTIWSGSVNRVSLPLHKIQEVSKTEEILFIPKF